MLDKKYKFSGNTKKINGHTVREIVAVKAFYCQGRLIKRGQVGGFIEGNNNLSHEGSCWVCRRAVIYGRAQIKDECLIAGNTTIYDNASLSGKVITTGDEVISISGDASLSGNIKITGTAIIAGNASLSGNISLSGNTRINASAKLTGKIRINGKVVISDTAQIDGCFKIDGDLTIMNNTRIDSKQSVNSFKKTYKPRKEVCMNEAQYKQFKEHTSNVQSFNGNLTRKYGWEGIRAN